MAARAKLIFRVLRKVERKAARLRGKGFGTASIGEEVASALRQLRSPARLAIDIGGNVGSYASELRARAPQVEIHVFEPAKVNYEHLVQRFRNDPLTIVNHAALSDQNGSATLFSDKPGSGLASLAKRDLSHLALSFDVEETVPTMRFAEYWDAALGRRPIDVMKMDIEGHELSALAGVGDAIGSVRVLQFEFGGCNIDTKTYLREFWSFFAARGFDLFRITPLGLELLPRYDESEEHFSTTNFVAVNRAVVAIPPPT
jgi:FkbM family methyltransferase